ncbi:OsmC family protein [Marinobacter sp. F4216]|uniref:OsmC family protein n=1 Tax=Marinobacter sp. F4216 TaxID=2874281 RepID=UPI001CBA819C|nr:OsmC family protein [Marinobacter sp. F4216]MBZ2169157.1 OsmC family protein [Marinobacter sp. F4216]
MTTQHIGKAVENVETYMRTRTGPEPDVCATAVVEDGLKCRIQSPDGRFVYTDMPEEVGGTATCNSPGWLMRAAIASCDATLLAMRAARCGIDLDSIVVRVDAMSDGRGMFLDEGISPGSSEMRVSFDIRAKNAPREEIQELVDWVIAHAPVGKDISQAVDISYSLKTE